MRSDEPGRDGFDTAMPDGANLPALQARPSFPRRVGRFLLRPAVRYTVAWLIALAAGAICLRGSWVALDEEERADGNGGHANVDFGAQWLMGAMVAQGHGRQLYNRVYQRELLRDALPEEDQAPNPKHSDVEWLMFWIMGRDDSEAARVVAGFTAPLAANDPLSAAAFLAAEQEQTPDDLARAAAPQVGGALYPPIHAIVYAPLGLLPPRLAYRLTQILSVLLAVPIGWGLRRISRGRISLPVAAAAVIIFPGFSNSTSLGQNAPLTLAILVWGWVFMAEGKDGLGGAVWGLLLLKPVWLAAFFPVLLLTGRWRACLATVGVAALLGLLTLPVVGLHSWFDWLEIGKEGADLYKTDENWIHVSRDLLGIPRRWLLDFSLSAAERDIYRPAPTVIGWGLWGLVAGKTALVALLRRKQAPAAEGPAAAFLLLGAMYSCFHFMHYDILLAALPVFLLFTDPWRYLTPLWRGIRSLLRRILPARLAGYLGVTAQPAPWPLHGPHWQSPWPETGKEDGELYQVEEERGQVSPNLHCIPERGPVSPALPAVASDNPPPLTPAYPGSVGLWVAPLLVGLLFFTKYGLHSLDISFIEELRAPWDTFCLLLLWLWCGAVWLRQKAPAPAAEKAAPAIPVPQATV